MSVDTLTRLKRNQEYIENNYIPLGMGSKPKPLFLNGLFNEDNWNGGDSIIRQYTSYIENSYDYERVYTYGDKKLFVSFSYYDDEKDILFTLKNSNGTYVTWEFEWYKNRGRIDNAEYCTNEMRECDYIELLEIIEEMTDFRFRYY